MLFAQREKYTEITSHTRNSSYKQCEQETNVFLWSSCKTYIFSVHKTAQQEDKHSNGRQSSALGIKRLTDTIAQRAAGLGA